jgi:hypothetical protein
MTPFEHSIEVGLSVTDAVGAWAEFPFRSLLGHFRAPGVRSEWTESDGSRSRGVTLFLSLGPRLTRITSRIAYSRGADGISPATTNAHVFADLTMFKRFAETLAADEAGLHGRVAG